MEVDAYRLSASFLEREQARMKPLATETLATQAAISRLTAGAVAEEVRADARERGGKMVAARIHRFAARAYRYSVEALNLTLEAVD